MVQEPMSPTPASVAREAPGVEGSYLCPRGLTAGQPCVDELLGTVAHELRGPLGTILSGVDFVTSECELDPAARLALGAVEHQSRQAMRLIDDLFDLCAGGLG